MIATILALALAIAPVASGAIRTWSGGSATSGNWTTSANWLGGTAPSAGDSLVFPGGAARLANTNNFTAGTAFAAISISGSGYAIQGNTIALSGGLSGDLAAGSSTFNPPLQFEAAQSISIPGASALLIVGGNINLNGYNLTISGAGDSLMTGAISGTGNVTKTGAGLLEWSGTTQNSFAGTTTVNQGTLTLGKFLISGRIAIPGNLVIGDGVGGAGADVVRLQASDQIAGTSEVTVNASGLLDLNGWSDATGGLRLGAGQINTGVGTLSPGGAITVFTTGTATINGRLNLGASTRTADVIGAGVLRMNAAISGTGGLLKTNAGFLVLAASNSFSGPLNIVGGYVEVMEDHALGATTTGTQVDGGVLRLVGTLVEAEPLGLAAGRLQAISASNAWTGPIQLTNNPAIEIPNAGQYLNLAGVVGGPGGFTKIGPGTLILSGASANTFDGDATLNDGLLLLDKTAVDGAIPGPGTLTIGDGNGDAESDVVRMLRGGQIGTAAPIAIRDSGLLDLNDLTETVGNLDLEGGYVRTGDGTLSLGGVVTATSTSNQTARVYGRVNIGSGTRTFTIRSGHFYPELRLIGSVVGSAAVLKNGPGWMGLSGSNSYSGLTTVAEGMLLLENSYAAGTTNAGTVVEDGAGLILNGPSHVGQESLSLSGRGPASWFTLGVMLGVSSNSWAGPVTLNSDVVIKPDNTNSQILLSGLVSGPGGFTKSGDGTLILGGTAGNTYAGDTTVTAGLLALAKDAGTGVAIRNGRLTIGDAVGGANADVVRFRANNQMWSTVAISIRSSGLLDLAGYTDSLGDLTISGGRAITSPTGLLSLYGTVTATNGHGTLEGRISLNGSRPFHTAAAAGANLYVAAQVGGAGGLTKTGPGQLYLYSSNSYDGPTTVAAGRIYADTGASLGTTNGACSVQSGASLVLRFDAQVGPKTLTLQGPGESNLGALASIYGSNVWAGPITLAASARVTTLQASDVLHLGGAITGGPADLTTEGAGTIVFAGSGANTYSGLTRVSSGTLALEKSGANRAIPGDLEIGDGVGGASSDVVRLLASTQIANDSHVTIAGSGLLDLDSHGEAIDRLDGSGRVNLGAGYLNVGTAGGSSTFDGVISGSGTISKLGSGTILFNGNNTYSGTSSLVGGKLVVNGSQPASAVTLDTGTILGGQGTVGPVTATGGIVSPGANAGSGAGLLHTGSLLLDGASTCVLELNGPVPGSLHDQIQVTGTVNLGGAILSLNADVLAAGYGDWFTLIDNDGADAVVGTFAGLPNNSTFQVGPRQFRILYNSGSGNDVQLQALQPPLIFANANAQGGNGNGAIDPNECHTLAVSLYNVATNTITGINATLVSTTPGVTVSQARATYPDIPPSSSRSGLQPFQISTSPLLVCGALLDFELTVDTAAHGTFRVRFSQASGSPGTAVTFAATDTPMATADSASVTSVVHVTGISAPIAKVTVSLHATHANLEDLDLSLIAPDGTLIYLSTDNGGSSDSYGLACVEGQRTVFDDAAPLSITSAPAPYVGRFRPQWPLSALIGLSGSAVNGTWRLRVADDTAGNTGALNCWTLSITPAACATGSGTCDLCGDTAIAGVITPSDPDGNRLVLTGTASDCAAPKACPGTASGQSDFHAYPFYSGHSNACITVSVSSPCPSSNAVSSAAYLGSYNPLSICNGYTADSGAGAFAGSPRTYSFTAPARTNFWIVVQMISNNAPCGEYTLEVAGGDCRPILDINAAGSQRYVLSWPTYAPGYRLQFTNALGQSPQGFATLPVVPVVRDSRYTVTNSQASTQGVYRLQK